MDNRPNASRIKADTIVIGAGPAGLGAALHWAILQSFWRVGKPWEDFATR